MKTQKEICNAFSSIENIKAAGDIFQYRNKKGKKTSKLKIKSKTLFIAVESS